MQKDYWDQYYLKNNSGQGLWQVPSSFAQFCMWWNILDRGTLIDVGCGNGRDTYYFSLLGIPTLGIDQCGLTIAKNIQKINESFYTAKFIQEDFTTLDYDDLVSGPYSVYSRFTFHAINYAEEDTFFDQLNQAKNLRYLFIEARSIRDSLYGQGTNVGPNEFVTTHYRRFINPITLIRKLHTCFNIKYFEENTGFAKTETEDPCLIRVIAEKRR